MNSSIERHYKRITRMASAYHEMLLEMQMLVSSELCTQEPGTDTEVRLFEINESLADAIVGLEGLNRANKREPFSA